MSKIFDKKNRIISEDTMEAGQKSCNAKLNTRDGYCQSPGVANFSRCPSHGGDKTVKALDLFAGAVGIEGAAKLQTLLDDTLSMDNELASGKTMLLDSLENYRRAGDVIDAFMETMPSRPLPGADEAEIEIYQSAVNLHSTMIDSAMALKASSFKQAHALLRTLTTAVHRNNKIKEGNKFTLDAKQIASILKLQLETMAKNCAGCPKLRDVTRGLKEGLSDIPLDPNLSKQNREIMGHRKYGEVLEEVNDLADKIYPE